jgi:hypothetical protein
MELWTWLVTRQPSIYAAFYLILIPFFAILYSLQDKGFYHSTITHERSFSQARAGVLAALEDGISRQFVGYHGTSVLLREENQLDIRNCKTYGLDIVDEMESPPVRIVRVSSTLSCSTQYIGKAESEARKRAIWAFTDSRQAPMDPRVLEFAGVQHDSSFAISFVYPPGTKSQIGSLLKVKVGLSVHPTFPGILDIFPKGQGDKDSEKFVSVEFSNDLYRKLDSYFLSSQGLPEHGIDNLGRMFYLSAVTVTTVGYGDIVPLTSLTRWLVALEAILGVVTVGLFLNALARRP